MCHKSLNNTPFFATTNARPQSSSDISDTSIVVLVRFVSRFPCILFLLLFLRRLAIIIIIGLTLFRLRLIRLRFIAKNVAFFADSGVAD